MELARFEPIDLAPFIQAWRPKASDKLSSYERSYPALCAFGTRVESLNDLTVLAFAAYGWMPTILKDIQLSECCLKEIRAGSLPGKPLVNNSWIGTSKLMHFIEPNLWPIWDSRVARHFGLPRSAQHNDRTVYESYVSFLRAEAQKVENPTEFSNLRFLELCLFSYEAS